MLDAASAPATTWGLDHPFDLRRAQIVAAGLPLRVTGERNGEPLDADLPAGPLGLRARAAFVGAALDAYEAGREALADAARNADGLARWAALARELSSSEPRNAAWLWLQIGAVESERGRATEAHEAFEAAIALASTPDDATLIALEASAWPQSDYAEAALRVRVDSAERDDLVIAAAATRLGELAFQRRNVAEAETRHRRALAIRRATAPGSPAVAESLLHLAHAAFERRALEEADGLFTETLTLLRELAPGSMLHADALRGTGNVLMIRGDPQAAAERYREALAIFESLAPEHRLTARARSNLGIAHWQQGDLATAERHFQTALAAIEALAPGTVEHAGLLNNLALVYHSRYEFAKAGAAYRRAADVFRSISPDSLELARALTNVALAEGLGGNPRGAIDALQEVLRIQERHQPDSTDVAQTHHALGLSYHRLGDFERAEESFRTALAMREALVPGGINAAITALSFAAALVDANRDAEAERLLRDALQTFERLAPGRAEEAEANYLLAGIHRRRGDLDGAAAYYDAALAALDKQTDRLGGADEARASFLERHAKHYKDYLVLLLERGEEEQAFDVLERYRARAFLGLLAERPLRLEGELPAELAELRERLTNEYDRLIASLQLLSAAPEHAERVAAMRAELDRVREERERLTTRIRNVAPRLAALQYPQPLRLDDARRVLPRGTLLLSYCVTATETFLFAIAAADDPTRRDLTVVPLGVDAERLRGDVERLRLLLRAPNAGPQVQEALAQLNDELYRRLVSPVEALLADAERVLIVPDGALHLLPFAALASRSPDGRLTYLIERLPVHTAVSVSVYAELSASTPPQRQPQLVAFGDPSYRQLQSSPTSTELVASRGRLQPLPYSRAEVETIGRMFGPASRLFLGSAAREEEAKSVAPDVTHLHFASHGVLDERFPLDSFLALSLPDAGDESEENGLLQAWEILEEVRLQADVVVLSACETALGAEAGGEGLLGLVRAFHYAGARSVLASLWSVGDRSTAVLMSELYRALRAGEPADEALRRAQLSLLHPSPIDRLRRLADFRHPYHWAAFQVYGAAY